MALNWGSIGEVANIAQLTGLDSVKLIALIVKAANNARMHKKNCKRFAQHLKLIGNLLGQLKLSDLKEWPETREPLEELEDALKRAFLLVNSCKDRSYLYLLALGWTTVNDFRQCQAEIDRLLRLIPLITLVDNNRERLRVIEKDQQEYTLDEEELKVHEAILKPEVTESDARVLEKSLSRSYPGLNFDEVLQKENNKLRKELHKMEECMEIDQCDIIHHLIDVTETSLPQKMGLKDSSKPKNSKYLESNNRTAKQANQDQTEDNHNDIQQPISEPKYVDESRTETASRSLEEKEMSSKRNFLNHESWQNGLCDCCMDPYLCISTFLYPCGTFSDVATIASDGKVSPEDACNDLMTYSLILGCFCYTCCFRRKLRKRFNIQGGCCDDFCTHTCCFCCALVQEWREITTREAESFSLTDGKLTPPSNQSMERES